MLLHMFLCCWRLLVSIRFTGMEEAVLSRNVMCLFDECVCLCRAITSLLFFPVLNDGCVHQIMGTLVLNIPAFFFFFHSRSVYRSASSPPTRSCILLILPSDIPGTGITFVGKWVKLTACLQAGVLALLGDRPNSKRAGSASYVVRTKSA